MLSCPVIQVLSITILSTAITVVGARQICEMKDGKEECRETNSLTPAAGAAIGLTVVCIVLLGVFVFLFIRRTRAQNKALEDSLAFHIESEQMKSEQKKGSRAATTYDMPDREKALYGSSTNPQPLAYSKGYAPFGSVKPDDTNALKGMSSAPTPRHAFSATRAKFHIKPPPLKHSSRSYVGSRF